MKKTKQRLEYEHFLIVSISAPERRAALTAFSSLRAAAVGAFFRITTGSQSCDNPPLIFFFSLLEKSLSCFSSLCYYASKLYSISVQPFIYRQILITYSNQCKLIIVTIK